MIPFNLFLTIGKQDPAKPSTELAFPSVTICSPGLNMEAVKEAVFQDFENWQLETGNPGANSPEDVDVFMEAKYGMKVGQGNIFDKVKEMASPPINKDDTSSSTLLENLATCKELRSSTSTTAGASSWRGNCNHWK